MYCVFDYFTVGRRLRDGNVKRIHTAGIVWPCCKVSSFLVEHWLSPT